MPDRPRSITQLRRYAAALAAVGAASGLRWLLTPLIGARFPYLLQFLTLLILARYLGFGPALLALLVSTSPVWFGIEFAGSPTPMAFQFWVTRLLAYGIAALLIWLVARHRQAQTEFASAISEKEREERFSAQLRAIVESSGDAIISKDLRGVIQSWNRGAEAVYGFTAGEAVGCPISIVVPPDRVHEEPDILERMTRGERVKHFETVRVRKDGTPIQVSLTLSPIRNPGGEVIGASHIARDITESKAMEEQFRQAQKLESLGVLAGGIAHDFNNLLTGVLGNASLALADLPEESPARPRIQEVMAASGRAAILVRQMLAYAGKARFLIERLNLSEQVSQIVPLIRGSIPPRARIELELSTDLPLVEADTAQIQQLIMNLTINAGEALGQDAGSVTIATYGRETDSERQVVLEVRDTGSGMDEETLARIFDPFFTTRFTGRGLGLSAVLGIVRGHRGSISVESAPGKGSVFTVVFPAASDDGSQAVTQPQMELRGSGHLLVVDEQAVSRKMAGFVLDRCGYTVETAPDLETGLQIFGARPHSFDAVLLDLAAVEGAQTAQQLRAVRPDVRLILSCDCSESEARTRFPAGAAGFVQKPYTATSLAWSIKQALR